MLYNIPSAGFISQTLEALSEGIVRSIERAQESLQPGRIYFIQGPLLGASVNRSPTAYLNNPSLERARYEHDTDKQMALLKFLDRKRRPIAMLNWFAVHGTSMNNSNHLVSSDNKGLAALLFEEAFNPAGSLPGRGPFVAIFAQANEGDVSPNTRGPRCTDTNLPCDSASSTCGSPPRNEKCIAMGPGRDMFESTKIIAHKQFYRARELFLEPEAKFERLRGPIRFVHEHIDMTKQQVPLYWSLANQMRQQQQQPPMARRASRRDATSGPPLAKDLSAPANLTLPTTCPAALGYSFAAGTTDGPGAFDFQQGDTASTRYWNMVRDFLRRPSQEQIRCHHPKPILLSTGEMDFPYMWHPHVVPTQIFTIGQLAIVGLPGEFTTMAGRRIREAVERELDASWLDGDGVAAATEEDYEQDHEDQLAGEEAKLRTNATNLVPDYRARARARFSPSQPRPHFRAVLSGLSNIYTSYVTTLEEYEVQRYEAASTLYGPHTLQAYLNQFVKLAGRLARAEGSPASDLRPPDLSKSLFTLKAGVIFDGAPRGKSFGQLLDDVDGSRVYRCGEQVSVSFVAGNPRNDLRQEQSFLYVDRFDEAGNKWLPVASDASWETKFIWERTNTLFGESRALIQWDISEPDCRSGVYRIRHYGAQKNLFQVVSQYAGESSAFRVLATSDLASAEAQAGELARLEAVLNLVERLETAERIKQQQQQQQQQQQASSQVGQPKSDRPASFLSRPLHLLSSLFHWRRH